MWGEIKINESEHPIIWAPALNPPETVCLKLLLNSWTSVVNLKINLIHVTILITQLQ